MDANHEPKAFLLLLPTEACTLKWRFPQEIATLKNPAMATSKGEMP
jgi:hypothetical protein